MTTGPTRVTAQAPILAGAMTVPARAMTAGPTTTAGMPGRVTRGRTSRVTRTVTRAGAIRSRPIRRGLTRSSAIRSRPIRSRAVVPSAGTRNTLIQVRAARGRRAPGGIPDPGTRTRATRLTETSTTRSRATRSRATRSRATRRPTRRLTRIRDTASTGIPGRPRATRSPTPTRGTAPSATAGRTLPTVPVVGSIRRIRTRRPPRASRLSRPSPMKQIRPRGGNRGGVAGVSSYQPVRLCPPGRTYCLRGIPFGWSRVAPFAERRPPHRST